VPGSTNAFQWDIGVGVTSSADADGIGYTQVDVPGEQKARVAHYENHFPYGLYGRVLDPAVDGNGNPDPSTANQVKYALEGGTGHAFPMENPSVLALLPTPKPGETLFHGPLGQFIRGTVDGQFALSAPPPAGSGQPDFIASFGSEGVMFVGRWGSLKLDDTGFHITTAAGATFDLGGVSGLPGPLSAVSSSCAMNAGSITLQGNTTIGGGELGIAPGVNGTFLLAMLTAIKTALTAIATTMATGTVGGPTAQQFATAAAVVAAVAAVVPATPVNLLTDSNATY
jgi:hypothetical protein